MKNLDSGQLTRPAKILGKGSESCDFIKRGHSNKFLHEQDRNMTALDISTHRSIKLLTLTDDSQAQ